MDCYKGREMEPRVVRCGSCNAVLHEVVGEVPPAREPCPVCGSMTQVTDQDLEATVTMRSHLAMSAKPPKGKPFMLQKVGDSFYRLTGRWHRLHQVIDRRGNRYYKRVEDAETGELVRLVDEPLPEHQGRGSARDKQK